MNLKEAKTFLNTCERHELRDHAFGDAEVVWEKDGKEVAIGSFGGAMSIVSIGEEFGGKSFIGFDARDLRECGTLGKVERNDMTGPDTYAEGVRMSGLTKEGVLEELTTPPKGE